MGNQAMIFHGIVPCVALLYNIVLCSSAPFICFKNGIVLFHAQYYKKINNFLA